MLFLVMILTAMNLHSPKYEVGECFSYFYSGNEFESPSQSAVIYKVLKQGRWGYLLELDYKSKPEYEYYYAIDAANYNKVECIGPMKWEH